MVFYIDILYYRLHILLDTKYTYINKYINIYKYNIYINLFIN